MVFIEENKQALADMIHKGFQGIVAALERTNVGQKMTSPKETYKVTSCHQETNRGACQLKAPQETMQAIFLWSDRKNQAGKKIKIKYF